MVALGVIDALLMTMRRYEIAVDADEAIVDDASLVLTALADVDKDAEPVAASSLTRCELAVTADVVPTAPDDSLTLDPLPVDNTVVEDVP